MTTGEDRSSFVSDWWLDRSSEPVLKWPPMSACPPSDSPLELTSPLSLDSTGVLIVDEDPAFQLGLKTFLKEHVGFASVRVANNGREALKLLREDPSIELVTLDYRMPELDGLGLLEHLKENPPRPLAVVMITGYPSDRLEEEFRGFHSPMLKTESFVSKPVDFAALEPVVLKAYESLRKEISIPVRPPTGLKEAPVLKAAVAEAVGQGQEVKESAELAAFETMLNDRMAALDERLERMESKLDDLNERTPTLMRRFWLTVLALIFVGGFAFLAYQMGWFIEAGRWIEQTLMVPAPDGAGN